MRKWVVASGIVEHDGCLLLVRNRRRDGRIDWSPPGGVIEVAEGEAVVDGLTREVQEETGLTVTAWEGPIWEVEAQSDRWDLRVEVHRAVNFVGELAPSDPDGIVEDAQFVRVDALDDAVASMWLPTHEPLVSWLAERWTDARVFRYRVVEGADRASMRITRLG